MRWIVGTAALLLLLVGGVWASWDIEHRMWSHPNDRSARQAFGKMLGVDIPSDVPVLSAQRAGSIDFQGCAVFEMTTSLAPILGQGANLTPKDSDWLLRCPDGYDQGVSARWIEYALPSTAHLRSDEIVALYRSDDDKYVKVMVVVH